MMEENTFQVNGMSLQTRELLIMVWQELQTMKQSSLSYRTEATDLSSKMELRILELHKEISHQNNLNQHNFNEITTKIQITDAVMVSNDKRNNRLVTWIAIILTIVQLASSILIALLLKK